MVSEGPMDSFLRRSASITPSKARYHDVLSDTSVDEAPLPSFRAMFPTSPTVVSVDLTTYPSTPPKLYGEHCFNPRDYIDARPKVPQRTKSNTNPEPEHIDLTDSPPHPPKPTEWRNPAEPVGEENEAPDEQQHDEQVEPTQSPRANRKSDVRVPLSETSGNSPPKETRRSNVLPGHNVLEEAVHAPASVLPDAVASIHLDEDAEPEPTVSIMDAWANQRSVTKRKPKKPPQRPVVVNVAAAAAPLPSPLLAPAHARPAVNQPVAEVFIDRPVERYIFISGKPDGFWRSVVSEDAAAAAARRKDRGRGLVWKMSDVHVVDLTKS
ncbi:hypothetical protein LTS18_010869 [Coniosporium uncinatum]|uniref:Uncharacterized protein n=1 Tax=Coniosporium uncinatum TaxID=93489 RepID=A0ACC3DKV5_9PEZI|nr:hypothetical protein LTS18_010869 [Coniosporium uncinatum]